MTAVREEQVAAVETPAVGEGWCWGGGNLQFGTLTTLDIAGSLWAGPKIGDGVFITKRGRGLLVSVRTPLTGKRGIVLKETVRPTGLSAPVGGLWTLGGSQFLRVQGSVEDTVSI